MQASKAPFGAGLTGSDPVKALPKEALETSLGTSMIEIDIVAAPVTAANSLRYVDAGAYDGGLFDRTVTPDNEVRIGVIQGSMRKGAVDYAPVPLKRTTSTAICRSRSLSPRQFACDVPDV